MIDYANETVTIFDGEEVTQPIKQWEVWFCTPEGTFRDFAVAKAKGGEAIIPVPVAVGETVFEIVTQGH